jgi:serine/threonine-protein kinase RsbW
MGQPSAQRVEFPSKLSELPAVQQQIIDTCEAHDYPQDAIFAIRLALDEALSNAVRHGNDNDPDKSVKVDFTCDDRELTVVIEDEGHGFKPDALPDPTAEENLNRPHGRGVMLMRAYMSDVQFNDRGNRVTLTKNRVCAAPRG